MITITGQCVCFLMTVFVLCVRRYAFECHSQNRAETFVFFYIIFIFLNSKICILIYITWLNAYIRFLLLLVDYKTLQYTYFRVPILLHMMCRDLHINTCSRKSLYAGADSGGANRARAPKALIWYKVRFFYMKYWFFKILHLKLLINSIYIPLTWNPGSAPGV